MKLFRKLLCVLLLIGSAVQVKAETIDAFDRGWYNLNPSGQVLAFANMNYLVGWQQRTAIEFRNFFAFDLSGLSGANYTSATLRLFNPGVGYMGYQYPGFCCAGTPENYQLHQITSDRGALLARTGGLDAFNDLGNGAVFGNYVATNADNGNFVEIVLNAAALAEINASFGGMFVLGGSITTLDRQFGPTGSETIFGFTNGYNMADTQLILERATSVPEPSTLLLLSGLVGLLAFSRRKSAV